MGHPVGERVGFSRSGPGNRQQRRKRTRSRCAVLDGAPLFRIETVEVGGCRRHGDDLPPRKKSDSAIPFVLTRTSALLARRQTLRNGSGHLTLTLRLEQIKNYSALETFDEGMSASV